MAGGGIAELPGGHIDKHVAGRDEPFVALAEQQLFMLRSSRSGASAAADSPEKAIFSIEEMSAAGSPWPETSAINTPNLPSPAWWKS
jgi:hypothetical protein